MADPTPEQQQAQYASIELLYSEGKWGEVLQASEALLTSLPPVEGHPLRPRLQLVIGHTLLYGLADLDGAEQHYRTVLVETGEPVLREIAELGLTRCSEQRQNSEVGSTAQAGAEDVVLETTSGSADSDGTESALSAAAEPAMVAQSPASPDPVGAPFTDEARGQAVAAAMPWETAAGGTVSGGATQGGGSAAMPWLVELGMESPAPVEVVATEPFANSVVSDSVQAVRNVETTTLQQPPQQMPLAEPQEAAPAAEPRATQSNATEETLALLREPDELIPVSVQVLEEPQPIPQEPEPAKEEPPLSPDEMAELARGLLEVVLR